MLREPFQNPLRLPRRGDGVISELGNLVVERELGFASDVDGVFDQPHIDVDAALVDQLVELPNGLLRWR